MFFFNKLKEMYSSNIDKKIRIKPKSSSIRYFALGFLSILFFALSACNSNDPSISVIHELKKGHVDYAQTKFESLRTFNDNYFDLESYFKGINKLKSINNAVNIDSFELGKEYAEVFALLKNINNKELKKIAVPLLKSSNEKSIKLLLDAANENYNKKQYKKALDALDKIYSLEGNYDELREASLIKSKIRDEYLITATKLYNNKQYDKSLTFLEYFNTDKVNNLKSKILNSYITLAKKHDKSGHINSALTYLNKASKIVNDDYAIAYNNMSYFELRQEYSEKIEEQKDIQKWRSKIRVTSIGCSDRNSANGIDLYIDFVNKSNKVIKYIEFEVSAYNRVGDKIDDEINGGATFIGKSIGPYKRGQGVSGGLDGEIYENAWYYGSEIRYISLDGVMVTYMDNTVEALHGDKAEWVRY
jgi:hypothetical protein